MMNIPQGMKTRLAWAGGGALVGILLTVSLTLRCGGSAPAPALPPADTASAEAWAEREAYLVAEAAAARSEASGLRGLVQDMARTIQGIEAREPERVVFYDTITQDLPPLALEVALRFSGAGQLSATGFVPAAGDSGGYRPRDLVGIDVRDCDDGWSLIDGVLQCDRPRFGHATLRLGIGGATPIADLVREPREGLARTRPLLEASLRWVPYWRSAWAAELTTSSREGGVAELVVSKAILGGG